ncbi:unnamed protein product [Choristocarpus tenellus]
MVLCSGPSWTVHGFSTDVHSGGIFGSMLSQTLSNSNDPHSVVAPGAEPLRLSHGTTTVAMVFDGGIIAAVDSRASMGSFVGSRTTMKVIPVSDHILGTMAGGAADCTFWLRYLGMQAKIFETKNGRPMAVRTAARVLANTLHGQRGRGLSVGTMVMGHDDEGGGQLFYVDSEGARVKGKYFSVGSGSTYAYSILDAGYRRDMALGEAAELARKAVRHATYRDASSGGFINVYHVDASGWSKLSRDDSGFMLFGEEDRAGRETGNVVPESSMVSLGGGSWTDSEGEADTKSLKGSREGETEDTPLTGSQGEGRE